MFRTTAKRLFPALRRCNNQLIFSPVPNVARVQTPRFSSSVASETIPSRNSAFPDPASSTAASSGESQEEKYRRFEEEKTDPGTPKTRHRAQYQDEQFRVLSASLPHVIKLGWTEAAMIAGAREAGLSPSILGSFHRKEAALVEFFMDECLERLIEVIESRTDLKTMIPSERVATIVRLRLELQSPYISKWAQALSIQAHPMNVLTSFKQRAMLVDEIWHAAGDDGSDIDWYVKRTGLGGIYSTTELYMLTDYSPDFHDTWAFLKARIKDAFDLRKSAQEAKYLAEAVGAGMGGSLQGLVRGVFTS
ncbi:unnamed protein product [Cuscuta europaea]|uniref:Ubiquinone biosynthesis protein n=1 Tax=Cuscuta europaea TaxID=41803 RepID=A0A9P0ZZZ8_CUSEU|nr:unnamed protein product [Cuscuta europaea]